MELKIDVEVGEYLSRDELKDEIRYAVEEYVTREVNDYFGVHRYRDFIRKVASDVFWRSIEEMGEDTHGAIRNAVRKTIVRLQPYQLIGKVHDFNTGKYELTHAQRVIDEEAEKMRPEIDAMLRSAMNKAIKDDFPAMCADALYDILARPSEVSE